MFNRRCRVLLIEDELEEVQDCQKMLSNAQSSIFSLGFELVWADTLDAGKKLLIQEEFDVVLLDLMLPDSRGMSTLENLQKVASGVPIIVQTMLEDETVAVKSLELGACGYLPKLVVDKDLLVYAIRSAIERHAQLITIGQMQRSKPVQEIELLEQIITGTANINSQLLGIEPLRVRMPDVFEQLIQAYSELMNQALEQQIYQIEDKISYRLSPLAEKLGYLKATPRDVIELHTNVLRLKTETVGQRKAEAYTQEGRFLLLELLGRLTAYYRRYYIGLSKINLVKNLDDLLSGTA